jgi:hypothetical protein
MSVSTEPVKLYYWREPGGLGKSNYVLVKILNLFHFMGKSTDIFGEKNRFQADI